MKALTLLIGPVVVLFGCANAINSKTSQNYAQSGYQAIQAGDWKSARQQFGRAIVNAELGGEPPRQLAVLKYEYGRASGVVCEWDSAERALADALRLDTESGGPRFMSAYELGRMHFDRKQFAKAKPYYEMVYLDFGKIGAETKDPLGYAEFLEEFASVLDESGAPQESSRYRERAAKIRETFPTGRSHTEKTPYGTQCT